MSSTYLTKDMQVEQLESRFYGVYLLCSESLEKRYSGKCYIGFTVNPTRRIKQHNRGRDFGGAKKTNNKGPWKMVMIVHGFPNNISALQFEWAWQQPVLSSRLKCFKELKRKLPKETYFQYNFRILSRMLNVGPWQRLPLIIRWLESDYECEFDPLYNPPKHMKILSGFVTVSKSLKSTQKDVIDCAIWASECHLCMQAIENVKQSRIGCLNNFCKLTCHIVCLANHILSSDPFQRGHYIPIAGKCPLCETPLLWIDLLQKKHKMQGTLADNYQYDSDEDQELNDLSCELSLTQSFEKPSDLLDIYELSD